MSVERDLVELADTAAANLGDGVTAGVAVLVAARSGFSFAQLRAAIQEDRLEADGTVAGDEPERAASQAIGLALGGNGDDPTVEVVLAGATSAPISPDELHQRLDEASIEGTRLASVDVDEDTRKLAAVLLLLNEGYSAEQIIDSMLFGYTTEAMFIDAPGHDVRRPAWSLLVPCDEVSFERIERVTWIGESVCRLVPAHDLTDAGAEATGDDGGPDPGEDAATSGSSTVFVGTGMVTRRAGAINDDGTREERRACVGIPTEMQLTLHDDGTIELFVVSLPSLNPDEDGDISCGPVDGQIHSGSWQPGEDGTSHFEVQSIAPDRTTGSIQGMVTDDVATGSGSFDSITYRADVSVEDGEIVVDEDNQVAEGYFELVYDFELPLAG